MSASTSIYHSAADQGEVSREEKLRQRAFEDEFGVINEYNKEFRFLDDDITVISSDKIHFRVHRARVELLGPTFRTMFELGPQNVTATTADGLHLRLVDRDMEAASVLNIIFGLLYGISLDLSYIKPSWSEREHLWDAVAFIRKYDSQFARSLLIAQVRAAILVKKVDGIKGFIALAALQDSEGCCETLRSYAWQFSCTESDDRQDILFGVDEKMSLNPASWPANYFEICPAKYVAALLRAYEYAATKPRGPAQDDAEVIADDFKEILRIWDIEHSKRLGHGTAD